MGMLFGSSGLRMRAAMIVGVLLLVVSADSNVAFAQAPPRGEVLQDAAGSAMAFEVAFLHE